jgi:hypothetical protein
MVALMEMELSVVVGTVAIWKLALKAPAGSLISDGTLATPGFPLDNLTVAPFASAAW